MNESNCFSLQRAPLRSPCVRKDVTSNLLPVHAMVKICLSEASETNPVGCGAVDSQVLVNEDALTIATAILAIIILGAEVRKVLRTRESLALINTTIRV